MLTEQGKKNWSEGRIRRLHIRPQYWDLLLTEGVTCPIVTDGWPDDTEFGAFAFDIRSCGFAIFVTSAEFDVADKCPNEPLVLHLDIGEPKRRINQHAERLLDFIRSIPADYKGMPGYVIWPGCQFPGPKQ